MTKHLTVFAIELDYMFY